MRIVYLADSIVPSRAANSIHVMKMCGALSRHGHDVLLVLPRYKLSKYEKGVEDIHEFYGIQDTFKIQFCETPGFKGHIYWRALKSALAAKRFKPDLIYSRDLWGSVLVTLIGQAVVHEFHGPAKKADGLKGLVINRFLQSQKLTKMVVISQALKDIFIEDGYSAQRLVVAHDAADEDIEEKEDLGAGVHIGYIGHLYQGRGIELILEVASKLSNATFHLIGGREEDIERFKQDTNQGNVIFHGFLKPSVVGRYRRSMDILLAPYQRDVRIWGGARDTSAYMSPLKIFEYMSSGKAVVASDLPVLHEVLNDRNAVLCAPEDVRQWTESIKSLILDKKRREALGKQAYQDFKSNYTWDIRAKTIISQISE